MEHIILLRGVTPNGKNAIPKMSYLVDILTEAGFQQVRTYIQSGNIILESDLDLEKIRERVHTLINENIDKFGPGTAQYTSDVIAHYVQTQTK